MLDVNVLPMLDVLWDGISKRKAGVANIRFQGLRFEVLSGSFLPTMCEIKKAPFLKGTKLSL